MSSKKRLRAFEAHGVEFTEQEDNQRIGNCPFCGKDRHFYVNEENMLWDCKRCSRSGNFESFLGEVAEASLDRIAPSSMARLTRDRGLPADAFAGWGIGWNSAKYTLPVKNQAGRVVDIRKWKPGQKVMSTPGCNLGLYGSHLLLPQRTRVFVCEGEWDTIAMNWAIGKSNIKAVAVGVPGASTFKREWVRLFQGHDVILCYDNDGAGEAGERKAWGMLDGVARSIQAVHWPDSLPQGYDLRDYIVRRINRPKEITRRLLGLAKGSPRGEGGVPAEARGSGSGDAQPGEGEVTSITFDECLSRFRKWLVLPDEGVLLVVLATVVSLQLAKKDPIWTHLVGFSGAAKSEILGALYDCPLTYHLSSLTPKSLASGAYDTGGKDPSLLPQLDGLCLVIKDLTTIFTQPESATAETIGVLRDAYDGQFSKKFGYGEVRRYKSTFSLVAGVTPAIDYLGRDSLLGERFLKYRIPAYSKEVERAVLRKAMMASDDGEQKQNDLREAAKAVLARDFSEVPLPTMTEEQVERIMDLASYVSHLRSEVPRNRYDPSEILARGSVEIPTRLAITMRKLALSASVVLGEARVSSRAMRIAETVALDTPPGKRSDIVRSVFELSKGGEPTTLKEISRYSGFPESTVRKSLTDLHFLGIADKERVGRADRWCCSETIRELFQNVRR